MEWKRQNAGRIVMKKGGNIDTELQFISATRQNCGRRRMKMMKSFKNPPKNSLYDLNLFLLRRERERKANSTMHAGYNFCALLLQCNMPWTAWIKARKSFRLKGTLKREKDGKSSATAMQMISIKLMWERSETGEREIAKFCEASEARLVHQHLPRRPCHTFVTFCHCRGFNWKLIIIEWHIFRELNWSGGWGSLLEADS